MGTVTTTKLASFAVAIFLLIAFATAEFTKFATVQKVSPEIGAHLSSSVITHAGLSATYGNGFVESTNNTKFSCRYMI
jgi:hypothetical protein